MNDDPLSSEFLIRLRAFVRKRVRSDSDADDITQDVMLKFTRDRNAIKVGQGPAWLFTVARREIVDRFRRATPTLTELTGEEADASPNNDAATIAELSHCVQPLLDTLPPADSELLRRVDLGGAVQAQIAEELGLPRSTVKARVQRARDRFHQALLACCTVAVDARGTPMSYAPQEVDACPCILKH